MSMIERIVFWSFFALAAFFGGAFYDVVENLREDVGRNTALLERPRIEASVYPGVPVALREQWSAAVGERNDAEGKLWMTFRVANRGGAEASAVTARLALAAPVAGVFAYGADGEAIEADAVSGGDAGSPVEVRFDSLPADEAALVFVAMTPDGFGLAPYAADARLRWADAAPHHWREVEVTGRSSEFGQEGVLAHLYGLGAPLSQG